MRGWDKEKAKQILNLLDGSQWGKSISIGLRLFVFGLIIFSLIYALGYWRALKKRPIVPINIEQYLEDGKEVNLKLNGDILNISNKGYRVLDEKGKIKKILKVEDCPELCEGYKPYGFEHNIIGFYGIGFNVESVRKEAGLGIELVRLWDFRGGILFTNIGGYFQLSYPIKKIFLFELNNTSISGGFGYDYMGVRGNNIGLRVKF